jgi:23S rRNA (pseudouridine1915-N3)-methyltransferase
LANLFLQGNIREAKIAKEVETSMKFSEIDRERWPELQPYMDTCLLPLTGLTGEESPWQATEALERLRDLLDAAEIPFKGRIISYPAVQYSLGGSLSEVDRLCKRLKSSGYRYVIAASAAVGLAELSEADLILGPDEAGALPDAADIAVRIRLLWKA